MACTFSSFPADCENRGISPGQFEMRERETLGFRKRVRVATVRKATFHAVSNFALKR